MDTLRNFFTLKYTYADPSWQRRAQLLIHLCGFFIGLAAVSVIGGLFLWEIGAMPIITFIIIGGIFVFLHIIQLTNQGLVELTRWYFIIVVQIITGLALYTAGLRSPAMVAISLPIIISATLFTQQEILWTALFEASYILLISVINSYTGQTDASWFANATPALISVFIFTFIQWIFVKEFLNATKHSDTIESQIQTVLDISKSSVQSSTVQDVLQNFCNQIRQTFRLSQVQIFLYQAESPNQVTLSSASGLEAQRTLSEGLKVSIDADTPISEAFKTHETRLVRATNLAHMQDGFYANTTSRLLIPMYFGDHQLGIVDLQSTETDVFTPYIINLLITLVQFISASVESLTLAVHRTEQDTEMDMLYSHIEKLTGEMTVLRQQNMNVIWGHFFEERGSVVGFDLDTTTNTTTPNNSLSPTLETVVNTGDMSITPTDTGHQLNIPIRMRGKVIGAMAFDINRKSALPERLIDMATTISERLSLALENARLIEETQSFAYRENQVSTVSAQLQAANNLEELLSIAVREFNEALGSTRTHIRLQASSSPMPTAEVTVAEGDTL